MNPASASSPVASSAHSQEPPGAAGRGAWLALIAALLGWMFDGAEMGVFSLVGRPALQSLIGSSQQFEGEFADPYFAKFDADDNGQLDATEAAKAKDGRVVVWLGLITGLFLVGAATGGVLFGWLGDRVGRVRAMTLSVLTYAVFTSLSGFVRSPLELGLLRFIASLGMGGEWSLGVALVMEAWPNRSRAFMAGLIGAAANVGYLLVGFVGLMITSVITNLTELLHGIGLPSELVERLVANGAWRIMMILGIVPALLTFFIRLFVPESRSWEEERARGTTSNWATVDLLGVLAGAIGPAIMVYLYGLERTGEFKHSNDVRIGATAIGLVMAVIGYTFPVVRYLQRMRGTPNEQALGNTLGRMLLAACLSGVALLGTWGATQQVPAWADKLAQTAHEKKVQELQDAGRADEVATVVRPQAKEWSLIWLSVGAIVGTIAAAFMGDWLGRRKAYFALCVLAFGSVLLLFQTNHEFGPQLLYCAFLAGVCTASFYGWLPLYLPELFRTSVRATGQGFGFNFGRILAAAGSFQLGTLFTLYAHGATIGDWRLPGDGGFASACTVLSLIYGLGMVLIWFAPETKGQPLPP